ncbi:MAG: hypothetical protein ACT4QA_17800 [Panacagrimonas sp.]
MDKIIARKSLREPDHDRRYWLGRAPAERLAAIDLLRQHYMALKNVEPGLQRVCRFVERTRG